MFDEHADETLHGTKRCAVHHHRTMRPIVWTDVGEIEAFGQVVVQLDGAKLPFPADDVLHKKINLWPVESGFAGRFGEWGAKALCGFPQRILSLVPVRWI